MKLWVYWLSGVIGTNWFWFWFLRHSVENHCILNSWCQFTNTGSNWDPYFKAWNRVSKQQGKNLPELFCYLSSYWLPAGHESFHCIFQNNLSPQWTAAVHDNERNKKESNIVRSSYFLYIPRSFINSFVATGFHRRAKLYGLNFITDMKNILLDSWTL